MRFPRSLLIGASAAVLGGLAGAPAAGAALPWNECAPSGFECSTLSVPVDRTGGVPGTIILSAHRAPALAGDRSTAVVALAGGPGQAAQPIAKGFRELLAPLLSTSDLLVFDQRGTGLSNPLQCAALKSNGAIRTVTRKCAEQIGPARAFFTTAQSVEDLEALRIAGGYAKLTLYGVSYGTKVALAYAARYPATTQALILDSVVRPDGPDAFRRSTLAAIPRALGTDLCGGSECRGITTSVVADVKKLAAKLAANDLRGPVYSGSGRRFTARLSVEGLLGILVAGDLDPTLRAELPGSLRAALTGDVKPILRLSARSAGLQNVARVPGDALSPARGFQQAAADNDPLFFTTLCEENTSLPWTRGAPELTRLAQANAAAKALPASTFATFPRAVALGGIPSLCAGWPVASAAPAAPGALPDVPVLILDGQGDLRTPVEDAQAVAASFPRAQVVAVPHTGHSVLGTEAADCAKKALAAFAAAAPVAACPAVDNPYSPTPRPPLKLSKVSGIKGYTPKVGQTVIAVNGTLTDARRQVIGSALGNGRVPQALGGLRHGSLRVLSASPLRIQLRAYEYVPGVRVTGTYAPSTGAQLTISGTAAARGTLRFTFTSGRDTVSGTLAGKRVSASSGRSLRMRSTDDALPSLTEALARGRLAAAGR
ncbi:hypothetical protein DSM112329_03841 [Paraconexibacter sp. AEG42_29]|uniref:prolyl aminopeptidase n=1 Tax=Paraconexibacter sp. AEG42_29 TaxID=2997339 RepID=A0AAU7AZB2_9ACTN